MKKIAMIGIVMVLGLVGCATAPTQTELVNYCSDKVGSRPDNYEEIVKEYFSTILKDPYSAVYRFGDVAPGWGKNSSLHGALTDSNIHCGWMVFVGVNAKNSYGGYAGEKMYRLLLENGRVVGKWEQTQFSGWVGGIN